MKHCLIFICLLVAGGGVLIQDSVADIVEETHINHWTGLDPWSRDACLYLTGYSENLPHPRFLRYGLATVEEENPEWHSSYGPWQQADFQRCFSVMLLFRMALKPQPAAEEVEQSTLKSVERSSIVRNEVIRGVQRENSR